MKFFPEHDTSNPHFTPRATRSFQVMSHFPGIFILTLALLAGSRAHACDFTLTPDPVHARPQGGDVWELGTPLTVHMNCGNVDPQHLIVHVANKDNSFAQTLFFGDYHEKTGTFTFTLPGADGYTLMVRSVGVGTRFRAVNIGARPVVGALGAVCEDTGGIYPTPAYKVTLTANIVDPDPPIPGSSKYGPVSGHWNGVDNATGHREWSPSGNVLGMQKGGHYTVSLSSWNYYLHNSEFAIDALPSGTVDLYCPNIPPVPRFEFNGHQQVGFPMFFYASSSFGEKSYDANGDALLFAWKVTSPDGTSNTSPPSDESTFTFTPASPGQYTVELLLSDGANVRTLAKSFNVTPAPGSHVSFSSLVIAQVIESPDKNGDGTLDLVEGKSLAITATATADNMSVVNGRSFRLTLTLPGQAAISAQTTSTTDGKLVFIVTGDQMAGTHGDPGEADLTITPPSDLSGIGQFKKVLHVTAKGSVKIGIYNGLNGEGASPLVGRFSELLGDLIQHLLPLSERPDSAVTPVVGGFAPFLPSRFKAQSHLTQLALWDQLRRPIESCQSDNVVAVMPKEYFDQYWPDTVVTPPAAGSGAFFVKEGPWLDGAYTADAPHLMVGSAAWAVGQGFGFKNVVAEPGKYKGYLTSPSEYWIDVILPKPFDDHIGMDALKDNFRTQGSLWVSRNHYNQLLSRTFVPPLTPAGIGARDVLRVGLEIGRQTASVATAVKASSCLRRLRYEVGNIVFRIKDPQGNPLDEQRIDVSEDDFRVALEGEPLVPLLVDLPYPAGGARVEIVRDGATILEESAQVLELEGALAYTAPDSFTGDPEAGRREIRRLIALMSDKLLTSDYPGGIQVLYRELRPAMHSLLKAKNKTHDLEFVLADWNALLSEVSLRLILIQNRSESGPEGLLRLTTDKESYSAGEKAAILGEARFIPEGKERELRLKLEMDGKRIKSIPGEAGRFHATSFRLTSGSHTILAQLQIQDRRAAAGLEAAEETFRKEIFDLERQIRKETDPELIEELEARKAKREHQIALITLELDRMRAPIGNPITKVIEAQ